jgi:hypothetical protein
MAVVVAQMQHLGIHPHRQAGNLGVSMNHRKWKKDIVAGYLQRVL